MSNKIAPGSLRSVCMLFLIFEKRMSNKNCARNFEVCNNDFSNISKKSEQKKCARNFKIG